MDLKHKGISWVGNMFQKFEAVCQEVDNIISQDKVKYVENQVSSARANVKRLYSDVVQGLLPPIGDPMRYEAKPPAQRGHAPINAYFRSVSHNEGKAASNVINKSSVGHGTSTIDQIDNWSRASCKVPIVNEEFAQVPNHSSLELNADLPLEKNDDVLLDKDLYENMKENAVSELLSEKNDGSLTNKLTLMESDDSHPLSHSLSNVSTEINDTNKKASSVCDGFDMQLEDDVLLVGNNDGVLTDKDESKSSEEDTTMKFNASDPLKHLANSTSCEVKATDEEAILFLNNSHLPMESSRLSWKNDCDLSNGNSNEFLKKVVTMEPNTADHLNENHLSHEWSGTNFVSKEADHSNLLLKSVVLSGRIDHVVMDKDSNKSPVKCAIFEDDPKSYLLNQPRNENGIIFTNEEASMVPDRNHQQLETEILARKNDDALAVKYSNESLKNDTILELKHDAIYPLKNQPRCTSSIIKYKNEEVSSVSNDSLLELESEDIFEKNSKASIDKAPDASCKEQANLELSAELTLHCGEVSIKGTLCNHGNVCEGDIVTSNGYPQESSIRCADVECIHEVEQASSILLLKMETTSKDLENGVGYSSNAADATSSELDSVVLTCGETVEETNPVSSLKPLAKGSFSAFRSSVNNLPSSTIVHEKPAEQNAYIECGSRPSFELVTSPSYGNKTSKMKFVSSRSSLSSMESLAGTHASRANDTAFLPDVYSSSQGCPHDSSAYILDAEMETVDLGHKVTLKDECDVVDYKALHAVSRRTQKLRSYKKRIQDAFTSKKRLAKEYEQLAIWYGDTDLELSTNSKQKLDKENASTSYVSDSEWELL